MGQTWVSLYERALLLATLTASLSVSPSPSLSPSVCVLRWVMDGPLPYKWA